MGEAKPYAIPKKLVWEAYKRVKANRGAAGVDGQSLVAFEQDHAVTTLGGGHGGLETAGAAPHHDHPSPPAGPGHDGRLASGARILDAPEPAVEPHPADALLIAR